MPPNNPNQRDPLSNWGASKLTMVDAYKPRQPITEIVHGIVSVPSLSLWYGSPGCLKSFILADLAMAVALGKPWLTAMPGSVGSGKTFTTIKSGVMWIDQDNGKNRTLDRFSALGKSYNAPQDSSIEFYSFAQPNLDLTKIDHTYSLIGIIANCGAKLVVIDNLATISGGCDENSSEMMTVMGNLRMIVEFAQVAVIVVHHSRKQTAMKGLIGDNLRGFSGIRGAIDTGLYISREPNTDTVAISAEKTRDADIPTFSALFTYQHKQPGSNQLDSARFYCEGTQYRSTRADIEQEILATLGAQTVPITQANLARIVHSNLNPTGGKVVVGYNRIRTEIDSLASIGMIKLVKNGNAFLYAVP